jgi:hypothetical protein
MATLVTAVSDITNGCQREVQEMSTGLIHTYITHISQKQSINRCYFDVQNPLETIESTH